MLVEYQWGLAAGWLRVRVIFEHTIDTWPLWLAVGSEGVVRWPRRCGETWWALRLHVTWHTRLTSLLLRRRSQTRSALSASGHYALEEVRWAVANSWWRLLGWTGMCGRTSPLLELVSESGYLVFVSVLSEYIETWL